MVSHSSLAVSLGAAFLLSSAAGFPSAGGFSRAIAKEAVSCEKNYAAIKAEEMDVIDRGMEVWAEVEEDSYTDEQRALVEQTRTLLESRTRPVDEKDFEIVDRARAILASETVWDREDDRVCEEGDTTFSLYCALYFASAETLGEYQHRRTALQEARFALQDATEGRDYEHRLKDFNNDPTTTLDDIYAVLSTARTRMEERLRLQEACAL